MTTSFQVPADIEATVKEVAGLKAACRTAIGGARVLAPHIANQVTALYELAGYDEGTADAMSAGVRARGVAIEELLEQLRNELASVGGIVAQAYRMHEENEAKRKTTASKAGVSTRAAGRTTALNV